MKQCYFKIYQAATSASLCAMLTEGVSACLELLGIITRQPFLEASVRVQAAHTVGLGQHSSVLLARRANPGSNAWAHRFSRCTATLATDSLAYPALSLPRDPHQTKNTAKNTSLSSQPHHFLLPPDMVFRAVKPSVHPPFAITQSLTESLIAASFCH
jgi:hypothetical protein